MKRFTAYLLAALLCFGMVAFTSCGKKDSDDKVLIVGIDDQFAPMGFRDEKTNEIIGFDIDLAREAITRMGYKAKFQPINWDNKILELDNGNIDFIWNGFTITDERKEQVLFTKPYLANSQAIVVKADSTIAKKADLAGKKVAAQKGSSGLEALESDKKLLESIDGKQAIDFPDYAKALSDLKIGRVDAIVLDIVVADYYTKVQPGTYKILDENLAPEEYGVGVKKGNDELLDKLQKALDEMIKDGKAGEISKKWFGSDKILK